jgi:hypothetical protein
MPVRRSIRTVAVAVALLAGGCGTTAVTASPAHPAVTEPPTRPSTARLTAPIRYPAHGGREWVTAPAQRGGADGHAGRLMRYRVLVEKDIGNLPAATFADQVRRILAAPRGWTSGGRWRFRRVGPGQSYDMTVYLTTPDTRDRLCGQGADGYTSCRNGDSVILNVARWVKGIPAYHGDLAAYRQYMVDHEVGHRLGQGHMLCPGRGEPAPVMQQQTLGLHGCTPNPWPYPDAGNHFYTGASGAYDDLAPPSDPGNE